MTDDNSENLNTGRVTYFIEISTDSLSSDPNHSVWIPGARPEEYRMYFEERRKYECNGWTYITSNSGADLHFLAIGDVKFDQANDQLGSASKGDGLTFKTNSHLYTIKRLNDQHIKVSARGSGKEKRQHDTFDLHILSISASPDTIGGGIHNGGSLPWTDATTPACKPNDDKD